MTSPQDLPTAIIGAGPVGLAAAARLERGMPVRVYEAGPAVGTNARDWGHVVRLFSPWEYNIDPAARAMMMRHGWQEPPAGA